MSNQCCLKRIFTLNHLKYTVFLMSIILLLWLIFQYVNEFLLDKSAKADHTEGVYFIALAILTAVLVIVAWIQLGGIQRIGRGDFLLRIDKRFASKEIIKARIMINELYRKNNGCENKIISAVSKEIRGIAESANPKDADQYIHLLNFLDFLETIAYFANKGRINKEDIRELLGGSLKYYHDVFKELIQYSRARFDNDDYYCEIEKLAQTKKILQSL